jgi:membrane-bound metal-dependent hydrolase YbcI (DUF457 family)
MWLLGHLAIGYFSASLVSRYTREKIVVPLVLLVSIMPDFDLFLRGIITHRGPTHSLLIAVALFVPILLIYGRGYAYFAALLSHLFADYFVATSAKMQLFWPITSVGYAAPAYLRLSGVLETVVEIGLFVLMLVVIYRRTRIEKSAGIEKKSPEHRRSFTIRLKLY